MKTSKYRAVPLAVGLALAAAVAVPATAQPQTLPELRESATGRIVLTNLDDGRTLPVAAGDDIEVRLTGGRAGGLSWAWGEPAASDPAILPRTASNAMPNGNATAVFHVEGSGTVEITAAKRCVAPSGCPAAVNPWKITLNSAAPAPAEAGPPQTESQVRSQTSARG